MKLFLTLIFLVVSKFMFAQTVTDISVIYSKNVKDSFDLFITTPAVMDNNRSYDVIYYCDANLKSGRKMRELIRSAVFAGKAGHTIFVGIGQRGNFHVLRRRDFILPVIKGTDTAGRSAEYGQIENFYQFLKKELIPQINITYKTNSANNAVVGHSLGGLFAFYCLFKNETVFKHYYALSPALWIDRYSIYHFNKLTGNNKVDKDLYFSAGGMEVMNHIKKGTRQMKDFLDQRKYPELRYIYAVHAGKTHNSQVELSLRYILSLP